jgi:hypothetical protein
MLSVLGLVFGEERRNRRFYCRRGKGALAVTAVLYPTWSRKVNFRRQFQLDFP